MSRVAISVFILLLDVAAITGNAVVIIAFITNQKLRKPSGCYVTNLAAADLCMSLVGIPFYIATVILNKWPFGEYFCAIWTGIERVCSLVSNFAIVAICFDRYWLVTKSSLYLSKHSIKSAKWRIAIIWIVALLLRVPFVIYGVVKTWKELAPNSVCDPRSIYDIPFQVGIYEYDTIYTLIATLGEFLIPLILIVVWGVQVYIYLDKRQKHRLQKAVERSRAMSLDFAFSQREIAQYRALEERRGSNQSFLSKLFSSEPKAPRCAGNGRSRSQDTVAGPLSDTDEELRYSKLQAKPHRKSLENGLPSRMGLRSDVGTLATSKISIILDPVPSNEAGVSVSDDEPANSRKSGDITPITISASQLSCKSKSSKQSLIPRKSASLNTLEVPTQSLLADYDTTKEFQTSRSTPSIVLSCMCDHNVLITPTEMIKDSSSTLQSTPSLDKNVSFKRTECAECKKQKAATTSRRFLDPMQDCFKPRSNSTPGILQTNIGDKSSLNVGGMVGGRARAGSTGSTCDFLDVPSRSHHRLTHPDSDTHGDHTENGDVHNNNRHPDHGDDTRNSSFSSCGSELPDSLSSIMTASEPPSPGAKRQSNEESYSAEFIQRVLNSKARRRYRSYRRRALMTIVFMICVFVVFQLPYVVVTCIYSFCTTDCLSDIVYESANWWYWAKVFLNPFVYAHISPEFRRYSCAVLRCKYKEKHKRRH